jgi:hypothetical protein
MYSAFIPPDRESQRRIQVAQLSWVRQSWKELPIQDSELPRLFNENSKRLPYIKDLICFGANKSGDDDILVLTNNDTGVRGDCCLQISAALQNNDAGYCFRKDFYHRMEKPIADEEVYKGMEYPGSDLFFFRVGWWRNYGQCYPDMLLGREAWDCTLRVLIEETNPNKPLAIPNICWHERHANGWEDRSIRYKLAGQLYNLGQARAFFKTRNINPMQFGIPR